MNRSTLISYAYSFVSHLFRDSRIDNVIIRSIYLFGSVARGDFDEESDVDIFIDSDNDLKKIIDRSFKRFLKSEVKKFELLGIENELKIIFGNLEEWELKNSVENDGVLLYSTSSATRLKSYFILTVESIKDITKRNRIMRKLSGRKEKHYKDKGIIEDLGGTVIGTRIFLLPSEKVNRVLKILSKENVKYTIEKIWK